MAASGGTWKLGNFRAQRPQLFGNPTSAVNVRKVERFAASRGYTMTRGTVGGQTSYEFSKPGVRGRIVATVPGYAIPGLERG